jgi:large subunit ribosomal protein L15
MPHKLRKIRKLRGSRTQGYGRVGQHRKQGSKGYRKAGRHKAGWSYILRYEPDYYGNKGFTSPKARKQKHTRNPINLQKLQQIAQTHATQQPNGKLLIDLQNLGYTKLLGKGKITQPLTIKIKAHSKTAQQKITEAGGEILTPQQTKE